MLSVQIKESSIKTRFLFIFEQITYIIIPTGNDTSRKGVVLMSLSDFKTQIKNIRKEALKIGFSISTMDGYLKIWNKFISWKGTNNFVYNEKDYIEFLLDYYKFDVNSYTNKSKSHYQQLMRSKRILDDFDTYKIV